MWKVGLVEGAIGQMNKIRVSYGGGVGFSWPVCQNLGVLGRLLRVFHFSGFTPAWGRQEIAFRLFGRARWWRGKIFDHDLGLLSGNHSP